LDSHKPKSKKKKKKKHTKDLDDEYNKNKPKNPRVRMHNKLKMIKELKHDISSLVTWAQAIRPWAQNLFNCGK
jgi:hypothetical protein